MKTPATPARTLFLFLAERFTDVMGSPPSPARLERFWRVAVRVSARRRRR